ncbi:MAG: hypothetical protein LBL31_03725 [Spirochaetaceae bacterium]|jgi:hypothetical protein|nr:hypothetical protein [Spirochaetaceae bacterium]
MTRFEHPFTKVYRAVLKEKHPDKALSDDSPIDSHDMPQDVVDAALKLYFSDKELIIGPRIHVEPADTTPKQKIKYAIRYA